MNRTLTVFLGEDPRVVGTLHYESVGRRERAMFEYAPEWLADATGFAIEPGLPLVSGRQFVVPLEGGSVFPNAIADTEPDGWARQVIRRDHAKRRQVERRAGRAGASPVLNAVDYLLAADDRSRVGALRYRDEAGLFQRAPEEGRRSAPPLLELPQLLAATRAVEAHEETLADLTYLRGRGTSLGGLRPKCSVVDENGLLAIGKFPSKDDDRAVTHGEVLALTLARSAGINVADARIVLSDGTPVALIRRFDRDIVGRRFHYVSAATLMGIRRGDSGDHTYTEIADAIRRHSAAAREDLEELWRRTAFSILINNVDDHLHNHGFLHVEKALWRLSPAFDLNPFPDRARELKTWISEDTGPESSVEGLLSVARYFGLTGVRAKAILSDVQTAVGKWRKVGAQLGMTKVQLEQFEEAFADPEA